MMSPMRNCLTRVIGCASRTITLPVVTTFGVVKARCAERTLCCDQEGNQCRPS